MKKNVKTCVRGLKLYPDYMEPRVDVTRKNRATGEIEPVQRSLIGQFIRNAEAAGKYVARREQQARKAEQRAERARRLARIRLEILAESDTRKRRI